MPEDNLPQMTHDEVTQLIRLVKQVDKTGETGKSAYETLKIHVTNAKLPVEVITEEDNLQVNAAIPADERKRIVEILSGSFLVPNQPS